MTIHKYKIKLSYVLYQIIHCNWHTFIQDYGLASHTNYFVWDNFIHEWRDLQFNVDSALQRLEKLLYSSVTYCQSFCQKYAQRKSPKKYIFFFLFRCLTWDTSPCFTSNKPTLPTKLLRLCTYAQSFSQRSAESKAPKKCFSYFFYYWC